MGVIIEKVTMELKLDNGKVSEDTSENQKSL